MTSMEAPRAIKKRKLLDKTLPNVILEDEEFTVDSKMYQELLDMEKRLDWTMTRKKVEVQDALGRPVTATRTLRLFLSHTVSGQEWQKTEGVGEDVNFETGDGIPAWQLKIEGRLLEVPHQRSKDKAPPRKFSTFIKQMIVEMDRDPALYPDGNIVEWLRRPNQEALDGFTIRRTGDKPVKLRILMYLEHQPEQFKVAPELGNVLGIKEDTRLGVIQALWNYIKIKNLQGKIDRKMIELDEYLRQAFRVDVIEFLKLPEAVDKFLMPPDPIILHYTINPSIQPPERPSAYDVEVKMDDVNLKARMSNVVVNMTSESSRELTKLDEEIALHVQSLHNSHIKRTFLRSFAKDPAEFVQTWLASQSRDLESVLGSGPSEGATVRQEELKRSEFFRLPWVEEAVAVQEGMRLASRIGVMQ
ncbi:hypothetical protein GLOTRDRAFT_138501 [Gloeophyllum trabeum ATCC 11539]|uniref:DM2 domain-containing protein n=1 Tax=Gloeophyllum trabeum (strain ATCC 11539 / FP-39264 / Madison 617) TaxID=670483 RepID=S7RMJ6_GLOTA|nr:uncharacterized protein GLOTRDRAFT_138501 [Gloeophyllum trabeum ATCC 11539]EPQ55665.1 hypothetical protein GLOTRDRAFT_138501 [Gloeophyllum trabeum ATCC 11539]